MSPLRRNKTPLNDTEKTERYDDLNHEIMHFSQTLMNFLSYLQVYEVFFYFHIKVMFFFRLHSFLICLDWPQTGIPVCSFYP